MIGERRSRMLPEPSEMRGPRPPGPQVVEQVVADLGLPLVKLGEKVQKQREAAVVFLHLAQVPGGGGGRRGRSFTWALS